MSVIKMYGYEAAQQTEYQAKKWATKEEMQTLSSGDELPSRRSPISSKLRSMPRSSWMPLLPPRLLPTPPSTSPKPIMPLRLRRWSMPRPNSRPPRTRKMLPTRHLTRQRLKNSRPTRLRLRHRPSLTQPRPRRTLRRKTTARVPSRSLRAWAPTTPQA